MKSDDEILSSADMIFQKRAVLPFYLMKQLSTSAQERSAMEKSVQATYSFALLHRLWLVATTAFVQLDLM